MNGKGERNEKNLVVKTNSAQPLEDAQVEDATGGAGEMDMSEFCNCTGKVCPRGVTQETFPLEDICWCARVGGQHICDYLRPLSNGEFKCAKFKYRKN